jgi:hypothetical protein|nr:MAG TPA: hypothetical protein [Caudoviricetes sp.]
MRLPDPIANTTTEAYLAYKAGVLKKSDLQPKLKHPTNHFDAWLAYWTGLTSEYPKNEKGEPECLFDEEALVAFLAGVTTTYPEEIKDPYDVRIVGYLKYLVSARFKQPEETFNNEELYLSMMKTATVENGTPGSSLTLNNTLKAPFDSVTIYGNTEQVNASGKNLLKLVARTEPSQGISSTMSDDGTVSYSGKMTGSWANITNYTIFPAPLPAGKYTFSIDHSRTHKVIFKYKLASGTFSETIANMTGTSTSSTFTITEPIIAGYLYVSAVSGSNLNDTVKAQLEYGDTATDYEPHTGGPINLYDAASSLPITVDGLTLKQKDGMLECTGATTKDNVRFQEKLITDLLENNTAYSVYADTPTANLRLTVRLKRKDNNNYEYYNTIDNQVSVFTWNTAVYSEALVYLVTGEKTFWNGSNSILSRFGVFKGNSFDGNNYAPVGMNTPTFGEIKGVKDITVFSQGKNLFDTRFDNRTVNGVEIKTYEDGSFELNGTPTIDFSLVNVFNSKSYIPSGKYKLRIEHLSGSVEKVWPGAYFVYTIPIQRGEQLYQDVLRPEDLNNSSKESSITVNDICDDYYNPFVWVPYHIEQKQAFWNYKKLRLRITCVKEDESTDFTEFVSNSLSSKLPTLYKIGNYQDYITMRNDKWYIVRNVGEKSLNGSENWFKTGEEKNIFICENIINSTANYVDGYCTHSDNSKSYPQKDKQFAIRGDGKNLCFLNMATNSITAFKNWLASEAAKNNPVRVLYPLNTPTEEEITDPAILRRLNAIKESGSYEGITRIVATGTGDNPPALLKFSALKFR